MTEVRPGSLGEHVSLPLDRLKLEITTHESAELARHRRWRDTVLFGTALSLFVIVFVATLWIGLLSPTAPPATSTAATGILVTLIGALGGFLGGRAAK